MKSRKLEHIFINLARIMAKLWHFNLKNFFQPKFMHLNVMSKNQYLIINYFVSYSQFTRSRAKSGWLEGKIDIVHVAILHIKLYTGLHAFQR